MKRRSTTKYFTETVEIDVSLGDWDDEDLLEEIRSRGYHVAEHADLISVESYWSQGNKKEALILLEREYPELHGISNLINQ